MEGGGWRQPSDPERLKHYVRCPTIVDDDRESLDHTGAQTAKRSKDDILREGLRRINKITDGALSEIELAALAAVHIDLEAPIDPKDEFTKAVYALECRIQTELDSTYPYHGRDVLSALKRLLEKERDILNLKLEKLDQAIAQPDSEYE